MKKLLFFSAFLVPLLFSSCSGDDNNDSGKSLYKTVSTDAYGNYTLTCLYENGRVTSATSVNLYNHITDHNEYSYDTFGNLVTETHFHSSGGPWTYNYIYDNAGRLIQIVSGDHLTNFTYDDINKTINGSFYFNDEGKIYRHTTYADYVDTQVHHDYSIVFEGDLPVKLIDKQTTASWHGPMGPPHISETTYTYDNEHDASLLGLPDAYEINTTLINNMKGASNILGQVLIPDTSKYLTKITAEYGTYNFHNEFNDKGLPVKITWETNGEMASETVFYYR